MKPTYLVIGAQKCATSTLCDLLGQHPQGFMSEPKEPYFFSHDDVFAKGWGWYESLFARAAGKAAIGEGSTTYSQKLLYPRAFERIVNHLPDVKLIYIVRNPFERIESHYLHLASKGGRERRPFAQAIRESPGYIDNTLYASQLAPYREAFGEDRLLALFFEDFRADQRAVLRRCYEFLGVDPTFEPGNVGHAARHESAAGRLDTPVLRPLRKAPGFRTLRDVAPTGVRETLRRVFKKPITARPQWDADLRRWVVERIGDDNREFLERYGKPSNYWGF